MVRLIMRRGPSIGTVYDLRDEVVTVGRGSKNTIIIHDNEVSREHCRLMRVGDDYELEDLNSSNGTFVNGQRVVRNWPLQHGFLIELGDSITLEYEHEALVPGINSLDGDTAAAHAPDEPRSYRVLMMIAGPDAGRVYTLVKPTVTVGRDLSNDIIIQDPEVSRFHLRVRRTTTGHEVEDMGSTNGTQLNRLPLTDVAELHEDDTLQLGTSVQLQYMVGDAAEPVEDTTSVRAPREASPATATETNSLYRLQKGASVTSALGTGIEPGSLRQHVFIAYAREDWERHIAPLTVSLQDAGLPVWVDQYLTQDSPVWRAAVDQALYECWMMVVVMTPRSLSTPHVKMAYRYFINRDKPLIPLVYEPTLTMPVELAKKRVLIHDRRDPNRSLQKLIHEIMELRSQIRP